MAVPAALGSVGSFLSTNVLGITDKAILTIQTGNKSAGSGVSGAGGGTNVPKTTNGVLQSGRVAPTAPAVSKTYQMKVQFNPSSISFRASSTDIPFQYLQENTDPEIPAQGCRPPSISMSVTLIFDQVNVKDCFMLEKFKLTTQDVAQLAVNKGINTTVYSVQKQTNAFVGMMMNDDTRTVTFEWANLRFKGEVTEVRADYTMFSTSGRPVRSQVRLSLSQRLDEKADFDYWNKAFETCFPQSSREFGGKSASEMITNLVNISL